MTASHPTITDGGRQPTSAKGTWPKALATISRRPDASGVSKSGRWARRLGWTKCRRTAAGRRDHGICQGTAAVTGVKLGKVRTKIRLDLAREFGTIINPDDFQWPSRWPIFGRPLKYVLEDLRASLRAPNRVPKHHGCSIRPLDLHP